MELFNEVEPDIIFRHLVWSVLFITGTGYYINNYIMSESNQYKEQIRHNRVTQSTLEQTRSINEDAKKKINSISRNAQKLDTFSISTNAAGIHKIVQQGFLKINVKRIGEENIPQNQLKKTKYSIDGEVGINNLSLILDIVPKLQAQNVSATLELPLFLKKNAKGNIDFSLGLSITQSTYLRKI
ncbi:hypothetical protein LS73_001315 [Helicobacter muridarum]|nr:hypothetical protein LS73_001315 [Helicobacter muridarum]